MFDAGVTRLESSVLLTSPPRAPGAGRPPKHGPEFALADTATRVLAGGVRVVDGAPGQRVASRARSAAAWRIVDSTNAGCLDVEHSQPTIRPAKASITNAVETNTPLISRT